MKRIVSIFLAVGLMLSLSACGHAHVWVDATCTAARTCSECGETEGEMLGHTWVDATCVEPKTCSVCGETEGEMLGHTWGDATCAEAKMCSVCGATEGEPLGHQVDVWSINKEATCAEEGEETGTCTRCAATVHRATQKLEHTPGEWVVTKAATSDSAGERTQSCTVCGTALSTEEFTLTPEEIEAEYKASCTSYEYDTIARDPDKYLLTYGKYTGEVIQVLEDGDEVQMRVNITRNRYGYSDTIYVMYTLKDGESRFLDDDIITIYGINMGTISYQSVLGATVTLPCVYAQYIDLN